MDLIRLARANYKDFVRYDVSGIILCVITIPLIES